MMSATRTFKNLRISVPVKNVCPELGAMIARIARKYVLRSDEIGFCFHNEFASELDPQKHNFRSIEALIDCLIANDYPLEWYFKDGDQYVRTTRHYFYWLSGIKVKRDYNLMNILSDISDDVISCDHQLPDFQMPKEVVINGCPEILSGIASLQRSGMKSWERV